MSYDDYWLSNDRYIYEIWTNMPQQLVSEKWYKKNVDVGEDVYIIDVHGISPQEITVKKCKDVVVVKTPKDVIEINIAEYKHNNYIVKKVIYRYGEILIYVSQGEPVTEILEIAISL